MSISTPRARSPRRRGDTGLASVMILLLMFVPLAFVITIPTAIEIVTRTQASTRVQSCAIIAANGVRTWINLAYRRDAPPPATVAQLTTIASQVYASTMCGSPASVGLGPWTIQQITQPAPGVYTVTVRQNYTSPYGAGWFRSTQWTVTGTSFWYATNGTVPQR